MAATTWLTIPVLLVVPALLAVPSPAQGAESVKPVCNAKARGRLWPEKTSHGAAVPIEICAPKGFGYRWQQVTVDVSQLRADAVEKPLVVSVAAVTRAAEDAKAGSPPE
jgi:hypothetical protein